MNDTNNYVYDLDSCRREALNALFAEYPGVIGVFGRMTSFFTNLCARLNDIKVPYEMLQYKMLLTISFMRTHICVCEHIFNSENIEAAILMRKQLELIARMKEVEVKDLEKLYDKVPNVVFGRPMNCLYGILSKIAHNADMQSLDMLGFHMVDETHKQICVYPIYTENTIYSFDVAIGLFLMFVTEVTVLQKLMLPDYDGQADGEALVDFLKYGLSTNIPFFKNLEGLTFDEKKQS
jgi:hypothetical protein